MNSFIYLISALDPCHLPTMSPPFSIFFRWQLSSNCTRLPLWVYDHVSLSLCVCLSRCMSWYLVVTNFMCVKTLFLCNERSYYSWQCFVFCLGHKALIGVMYLTVPFPYCEYFLFHLWGGPLWGWGPWRTCGVLSKYLAFREAVHGLEVGDPAHMSYGFEITKGSLTWEETHRWKTAQSWKALN